MAQHNDAFGHPLSVGDEVFYVYSDEHGTFFCQAQVVDVLPKTVKVIIREYRHRGVAVPHPEPQGEIEEAKSVASYSLIRR
jgi:hypothetical protein